jgi:hypothetical protein
MTNTITIDSRVYADVTDYAKRHDLNITHLVEEYLKKLKIPVGGLSVR